MNSCVSLISKTISDRALDHPDEGLEVVHEVALLVAALLEVMDPEVDLDPEAGK